jgi:hypothetical protein
MVSKIYWLVAEINQNSKIFAVVSVLDESIFEMNL